MCRRRFRTPVPASIALTVLLAVSGFASTAGATQIVELIDVQGGFVSGTYIITPSTEVWGFGVGNDTVQDTSVSGARSRGIDGLIANDHWVSKIISRSSWDAGTVDWDSISPIPSTPPSSF